MINRVLITGNHPISNDLTRQFQTRGMSVEHIPNLAEGSSQPLDAYGEACLLSAAEGEPVKADNEVMEALERMAAAYNAEGNDGRKPVCHLLLRSQSLLHMIRLEGFRKDIEEKLEVYPFTMEDEWCRRLASRLDREPVTLQSEKTVHMVIFGMSPIAELAAINAAHVCHFPNYIRNHTKRTRITVIAPKAREKSTEWTQRYEQLFSNCYYRFVDTRQQPAVTATIPPGRKGAAEDFVDIEWEFVSASPYDVLVRNKLRQWALSTSQLLTIVFADADAEPSLNDALHLPDEVGAAGVPIYVYMQSDQALRPISHSGKVADIRPFGMADHGYDSSLPYIQMAKTVNYIYSQCRVMKKDDGSWKMEYAVEVDAEERERLWRALPFNKRMSSIYNAMTIATKMRSMGFKDDDWERFYDISQNEIETLAQVEHNRWSVEELILGWRPCTEQEQLEVEADISKKEVLKKRKIHYDLRAYNDLRPDDSGKPVQIYDRCLSACIPLIAKESKGGNK